MSARDVIREAFILNVTRSPTTKANAAIDALASSGYRILAPGALDRETLEAAAKVADKFDCWLGSYESVVAQNNYEGGVLDASQGIAHAIRALGGGEG